MKTTCLCEICRDQLPFDMPAELIESITKGDIVLFAGAGISTESSQIFKETLYEDILYDLKLDKKSEISFPDLMSKFCADTTNGRQKLLEKIKYRFDYCHQFKELYRGASRFHREIAPLFMIKNIITTNWDDYFERECNAIPIVTAEDFAFYNINQRKVFKIHGSISNYGSIVATTEDYKKCYKRLNTGLIGANLKTLLATKTIVFVGYSFRDFDFLKILEYLKKEMGNILPHIYIITLDDKANNRIQGIKSTIIKTDGIYFFSVLRKHLENKKNIFSEDSIDSLYYVEDLRHTAHKLVSDHLIKVKSSSLIYCLFYQDGVQHAIDCLKFKSKSGETYDPYYLFNQVETHKSEIRKNLSKSRNYADLAYVDGYIQGLMIPIIYKDPKDFPFFYLFGIGPMDSVKEFKKAINQKIIYHKDAEKYGQRYFKEYFNADIVMHHKPFIF